MLLEEPNSLNSSGQRTLEKQYHCVKSVQIRSFSLPVFSRIRTEYGVYLSEYSVRIRENTDQKKLPIWTIFTQCICS